MSLRALYKMRVFADNCVCYETRVAIQTLDKLHMTSCPLEGDSTSATKDFVAHNFLDDLVAIIDNTRSQISIGL